MSFNLVRWNNRKIDDKETMVKMIKTIEGKGLTYKPLGKQI